MRHPPSLDNLAMVYLHEAANMQAMIQFTNIPVAQNRAFAGPMGANPTDAQQGARDPDIGAQFQDCNENGIHN